MIHQNLSTLRKLMLLKGATGGSKAVEAEVTGNPVTFLTDLAKPLKSLLVPFLPVQSGSGDPSPQNIRPILPWNGLKVWNGGKNLLPESAVEYGSYNTSGEKLQDGNNKYRRLSVNLPAGNYVFSTDTTNCYIIRLLIDNTVVGMGGAIRSKNFTLTAPANVKIVWRNETTTEITETLHNQIELGSSVSAYEAPHITETDISFPSPVYGGTLDVVSGVLTVDFAVISKKWGDFEYVGTAYGYDAKRVQLTEDVLHAENGGGNSGNHYCDVMIYAYATASAETSHYYISTQKVLVVYLPEGTDTDTDIFILAKLTTPQEITLTPEQITAIKGNNTIWSDANGDLTAVYLKKG